MTRYAAPKLAGYAGLSAFGLLTALVFSRPELVALTAPFLLALAAGLVLATPPRLSARVELDHERLLEGDEVAARIVVESGTRVDRLDLYVQLPDGVELADGRNPLALRLAAGEHAGARHHATRNALGRAHARPAVHPRPRPARLPRLGGDGSDAPAAARLSARGRPAPLLQPRETQVFSGNEVSRRKGEGIEFADIRLWGPGDPLNRINWRASARRNELWVNESHPERNTDVIIFVDSFAEARLGDRERSTSPCARHRRSPTRTSAGAIASA